MKITVSLKIKLSFKPNKLGQIYVQWYIKTQILRYVSACSVGRKYTTQNAHCALVQWDHHCHQRHVHHRHLHSHHHQPLCSTLWWRCAWSSPSISPPPLSVSTSPSMMSPIVQTTDHPLPALHNVRRVWKWSESQLFFSSRSSASPCLASSSTPPRWGQHVDIDFDIDKTLTLTWTRHWQDIDKALTRLLHRPEHRPLPALRVHLETDYVGLPRLAHPASSVDHDCGPVQVVLVVIKTMI